VSAVTSWVNGALAWGQQIVQWAQQAAGILLGAQNKGGPTKVSGPTSQPVPSQHSGSGQTLYLSDLTGGCSICNQLMADYPDAKKVQGLSPRGHLSTLADPFPAAGGVIVGAMPRLQGGGRIGGAVGFQYGPSPVPNGYGGCFCPPGYTFVSSDPTCCSCGLCVKNSAVGSMVGAIGLPRLQGGGVVGETSTQQIEAQYGVDALRDWIINQEKKIIPPFYYVGGLQGGGNVGSRVGGTHVIVGEAGESEAIIPAHLWGGDWSTVLNSLPRLAKGGITGTGGFHDTSGTKTEEHTRKTEENTRKIEENTRKLGKHPTQKQIDKYNQEQQLQQWDKSQLGGSKSAYYAPSRTADQEIEYLTAVALNTGETNAQLQKQINLVNTYYPLYGKAASSTIDVKGALEKLAADFATLPGGYKAGGATAATPGAWEDLKTHKWNYQTSDEEVAYLTELAVNTKETAAQLQKQINAAETYYKASGRDTSKISDATTLIAAYGAQTAANTAKAAAETNKNITSLVSTVTSGISSIGDAVFGLMSAQESLKMLPQRFGGVLTNLDYYPPYTSQPEGSGTPQIVTALSGSGTAIGSNSVVSNLQQYGQAQITTNKSIFDSVMNLASTAGSSIMGVISGVSNLTTASTDSATKTGGSINTNGANLVSAVNNNTNSTSNAISNLSSVMGSGGSSGGSSGISGIISGIVDIFKGIFNLVTDISNTIAEQKQPTSGNFSYDGSYYITHSTKAPIDWGKIIGDVGTIFTGIGAVATGAMGMMGMQHGGIITRPTRVLAGEAGPEAVIPLNKVGSFGTQYTINMHVSGDENDAAVKRMADKVVKQIQRNELLQTGWY